MNIKYFKIFVNYHGQFSVDFLSFPNYRIDNINWYSKWFTMIHFLIEFAVNSYHCDPFGFILCQWPRFLHFRYLYFLKFWIEIQNIDNQQYQNAGNGCKTKRNVNENLLLSRLTKYDAKMWQHSSSRSFRSVTVVTNRIYIS